MMDVPRKTLDDYILIVRYGRLFKFDFHRHQHEKGKVLRDFIINRRSLLKRGLGLDRMSSMLSKDQKDNLDFIQLLSGPHHKNGAQ